MWFDLALSIVGDERGLAVLNRAAKARVGRAYAPAAPLVARCAQSYRRLLLPQLPTAIHRDGRARLTLPVSCYCRTWKVIRGVLCRMQLRAVFSGLICREGGAVKGRFFDHYLQGGTTDEPDAG